MTKVFAILQEPASYTVDRNHAVYDKLGVEYCYIQSTSLAKSNVGNAHNSLSELSFPKLLKQLRNILSQNDIVIINGYANKFFLLLFGLNLYYRKNIGIDSDTTLKLSGNRMKMFIKSIFLKSIFRNKRIYGLPGGTNMHKQLFSYYGMPNDRIFLMPMVVNNEIFKNDNLHISRPFKFLFTGRLIPLKNLSLLIDAFSRAFSNNLNVELRIVGAGELFDELKSRIKDIKNITLVGPKFGTDLRCEYFSASAFILPSYFEQWGLVVNEAMAAGLPVIVSDQVGAGYDLVEGHNTGFIFKFNDVDDLKDKMIRLVEDRELYDKFSRNAYNRINKEWNYDFYTKCLEQFIAKAGK